MCEVKLSKLAKKLKPGIYRHFKGNFYEVLGIAKDCEDPNKEFVVYQARYGENLTWVRSLENFLQSVELHGKKTARFQKIRKQQKNKTTR